MRSLMFLLLGLASLMLAAHSQGVPETRGQSMMIGAFHDGASEVGEPGPNPRQCNCQEKGRGRKGSSHCLCHQKPARNSKGGKLKKKCQLNSKPMKCRHSYKSKMNKFGPSAPL